MADDQTTGGPRYVGLRCGICGAQSPTVDQRVDVHRDAMNEWWSKHKLTHLPHPIIETREAV